DADVYGPPVRIEHRLKVDDLAADEARQHEDERRKRQRERAEEAIVFPARDQHRGDAGPEGERETQIVEVRERDVAEDPRQLREVASLPYEDVNLAVARRYPAHH